MQAVRHLLAHRRRWLAALLALTLGVRLLVPAGFMPSVERGTAVLSLCPGVAAAAMPDMPGKHHGTHHERGDSACPFGALAASPLGAVDAPLLLAALLFVLALARRIVVPVPPAPPGRLRPPLRAPPLAA